MSINKTDEIIFSNGKYTKKIYYESLPNKYIISDENKNKILSFITVDFNIFWKYDFDRECYQNILLEAIKMSYNKNNTKKEIDEYIENNTNIDIIIFTYNGKETRFTIQSLWGCNPPLSNIKYIVDHIYDLQFIGSRTDQLCEELHLKMIKFNE